MIGYGQFMRDKKQETPVTDTMPLVHYRKKDAARMRQMDEMQGCVEGKVREVMDSFRESPSQLEVLDKKLRRENLSSESGRSMAGRHLPGMTGNTLWMLAFAVLLVGVTYLFFA